MILGIDEVGRWPWAGPITSAGCIFLEPGKCLSKLPDLQDSKKLSEEKREEISACIHTLKENGYLDFHITDSNAHIIDKFGIREANRKNMEKIIQYFEKKYLLEKVIIDGRDNFSFKKIIAPVEYIIKGDSKISEIMAASIIAKVNRDTYMKKMAKKYPEYGFENHKGYGTEKHQKALDAHGPCKIHRESFEPIKKLIEN